MKRARYREILGLKSQGLSNTEVAAAAGCSRNTVSATVRLAGEAGLEWPLPEDLGGFQLMRLLHPALGGPSGNYAEPDFARVHAELAKKGGHALAAVRRVPRRLRRLGRGRPAR